MLIILFVRLQVAISLRRFPQQPFAKFYRKAAARDCAPGAHIRHKYQQGASIKIWLFLTCESAFDSHFYRVSFFPVFGESQAKRAVSWWRRGSASKRALRGRHWAMRALAIRSRYRKITLSRKNFGGNLRTNGGLNRKNPTSTHAIW